MNKLRANQPQGTQTYSDHEKAMKLLYALDRKVWEVKVQTIIESVSYETLTVDELFNKLKASERRSSLELRWKVIMLMPPPPSRWP